VAAGDHHAGLIPKEDLVNKSGRPRRPVVAAAVEALECRRLLAGGATLDASFGSGGKAIVDLPNNFNDSVQRVVLQGDGKILVLSGASLSRLNANGSVDATFGTGGTMTLPAFGAAFALTPDQKIVAAARLVGQEDVVAIYRYTAGGKVDTSFGGGDGQVVQPLFGGGATFEKEIAKVLVRPDGRILLAGSVNTSDRSDFGFDFALESFTATGDVDPNFGVEFPGVSLADFGAIDKLHDVVLAPGNTIIGVGSKTVSDSHHPFALQDFAIARWLGTGQPDNSFDGDGRETVSFGSYPQTHPLAEPPFDAWDDAGRVAVYPSGTIVVLGSSSDPTDGDPSYAALLRLNSTGQIDATFGAGGADGDGRVTLSLPVVSDFVLQPDFKLLLSGTENGNFVLYRLGINGALDPTFGSGGKVVTDFGTGFALEKAETIALGVDGRVLLAGESVVPSLEPNSPPPKAAFARYVIDAPSGVPEQSPFGGFTPDIGSGIQFENFDEGGEGVAYHDLDAANLGGAYRSEGADVQAIPASRGGGNALAFAKAGEWTEYTVLANDAGTYSASIVYASLKGGGRFHLEVDGKPVTGTLTLPATGDWQKYQGFFLPRIDLAGGRHVVRLAMDANDGTGYVANFDRAVFSRITFSVTTPFKGTPFVPNQRIEAEDYDLGGQGFSYRDGDLQNVTGAYRPGEAVDVEASGDAGGGFNVGYAKANEFLVYSLNVPAAGAFALQARVASLRGGGRFHFEIDGRVVASFVAPNTGGWQTYATVSSAKDIALTAGAHALRLVMDQDDVTGYVANFNWLNLAQ
jgi:uncharacterized delta-60 repeat protein